MKTKPFTRQLKRVRKICLGLPDTSEKLSFGAPTFFTRKGVFVKFANNVHNDGHLAVWVPAPPGLQEALIAEAPKAYYRPPYLGGRGWVAIELDQVTDETLAAHIRQGWNLIGKRK